MVKLHKEDEHVYYWAWTEKDNPEHYYFSQKEPEWFRVFRSMPNTLHDDPITGAMSKEEAIAYCARIIKLTGGREL